MRNSSQRSVVQSQTKGRGELASRRTRNRAALVELDRPLNSFNAADAIQVSVFKSFGLFEILRITIHHPNRSLSNVTNLAAGSSEDASEYRGLIFEEESREGDGEDKREVFGPVT